MTAMTTGGAWPPVPSERERRRALRRMPDDPSWEWARARVLPVIELPEPTSSPGDPHITVSGPFGMRIGFGIDLRDVMVRVPETLATRWQIMHYAVEEAALENLRLLAANLAPADVHEMMHEGTLARSLTVPPGNATALILIPDELQRLLGPDRTTLVTVSRGLLLALPADATLETVWDFMTVITHIEPFPLQEGPFTLEHGRLDDWDPPPDPSPRRRVRVRRARS